jgi:hypothetical protein
VVAHNLPIPFNRERSRAFWTESSLSMRLDRLDIGEMHYRVKV